jgi:ATP-dependent protease ClpP protease subunit
MSHQYKRHSFQADVKFRFEPPASALARWQEGIHAAESDDEKTYNIYSVIGEDYWTGDGTTPKSVSEFLKKNKGQDVTININSPGGSFFDGNAIYNLLKEHDGGVTVRIVGLAASAASIVAMAGDTIEIAESGFLMIHNSWMIAIGNKADMAEIAAMLSKFDKSMAGVYSKKTGITEKEIVSLMDDESWIDGKDAVEKGFATALLPSDDLAVDESAKSSYTPAIRKVDTELARAGVPRSERRSLIKELTGTPRAAGDRGRCAAHRDGGAVPARAIEPAGTGRCPAVRCDRDLPDRRGAGRGGAGLRYANHSAGRQDRRPWQCLCRGGQASGVWRGGYRHDCRSFRDSGAG